MPTVVRRGRQSQPRAARLIFCAALRGCCVPCWGIITDLTSVGGRGGDGLGELSLDASHPEVTLSRFYALRRERASVQQGRKSCVRGGAEIKEGKALETEVPRLAARGQIVADSAETGQLRCYCPLMKLQHFCQSQLQILKKKKNLKLLTLSHRH